MTTKVTLIGDGAVNSSTILNTTIKTEDIENNAVTSDKLQSGGNDNDRAVTTNHIRDNAVTAAKIAPGVTFTSGTLMLFQQTTAPTGWIKQTTHNNKALRVVSGSASSGGSTTFTSVFTSRTPAGTVANHTLTTAQIPAHSHQVSSFSSYLTDNNTPESGQWVDWGNNPNAIGGALFSFDAGGGEAHSHGFTGTEMDFAVQYVDLIIASKN